LVRKIERLSADAGLVSNSAIGKNPLGPHFLV
jgi:hypothetical protein